MIELPGLGRRELQCCLPFLALMHTKRVHPLISHDMLGDLG